jgi:hypothetical protein
MGQNNVGFTYLKNKFPSASDAKIKEEVFFGLQIRKLIQDVKFNGKLNYWKKQHGNHSKMSLPIFWKITRQKTTVTWWLILYNPYKAVRHTMPLKRYFLHGAVSDFTKTFPPPKSSTKASGVPVCWLIIA